MNKIKVFMIDDSLLVRKTFSKIIESAEDMDLIGEAANPIEAFAVFKEVGLPDVFILDIEMPKMTGLEFLKLINEQKPIPVVICSTLVSEGSSAAIDALRLGATDIVLKPKSALTKFFDDNANEFLNIIRAASKAKVKLKLQDVNLPVSNKTVATDLKKAVKLVAIGSSTGGVQVIEEITTHLKAGHCAVVITQHMPESFTGAFAKRLDSISANTTVKEATDGEIIYDGHVYISPGGIHMKVKKSGINYVIALEQGEKVNSHKPSVDVLFHSVAKEVGNLSTAFILTGMGHDGALGLKAILDAGGKTVAQNEKSCVVYGMPKVAVDMGATNQTASIFEITKIINEIK